MKKEAYKTHSLVICDFSNKILYDGKQIQTHFVTKEFEVIGNSVLVFRGGMRLSAKEMLDHKDIIREGHLTEFLISSDDTLHFIIEEFDVQPPNIEIAYYRLRMLCQLLCEFLISRGHSPDRKGTDIYIDGKKLNVGIASISNISSKIHFGVNIKDTGIPNHVKATSLTNLGIVEQELEEIASNLAKAYIREYSNVKMDICKTKPIH